MINLPAIPDELETQQALLEKKLTSQELAFCRKVIDGTSPKLSYFDVYRSKGSYDIDDPGESKACSKSASRLLSRVCVRRYIEHITGRPVETEIVSASEALAVLKEVMEDASTSTSDRIKSAQTILSTLSKTREPEHREAKSGSIQGVIIQLEEKLIQKT